MKKKIFAVVMIFICLMVPIYVSADDVSGNGADTGNTVSGESVSSVTYYDALLAKELEQQNYEIYRAQLNAQLANAKLEYLTALESEWAEKCDIEEKKLELGYFISIRDCKKKFKH